MIIGRMNKRIELQQFTKIPDGQGGYKQEWLTISKVWAEFKKPSLGTTTENGAIISNMTREISIRFRNDVRKGWRVLYGTRVFMVEHTFDYGKETTIIVCKEVVK